MMQNFGKRKFGGTRSSPFEFKMSAKNQKPRQGRDIVYTEDAVPVRKLYFCVPTADITRPLLRKHFALFGPIDQFTLHLKPSYCYGFIQYKSVYNAASALQNQLHYVGGFKIRVSVADSWHQPRTIIENDQQTDSAAVAAGGSASTSAETSSQIDNDSTHFLDLNDDCLLQIFNSLGCIDLSAVDQTCVRFQQIAGEIFRKKHTAINLTVPDLPGYSNVRVTELTLLQIRSLFKSYGPQIQKLHVAAVSIMPKNRYRVLEMIIRSCTSLKTLYLTGFFIKESLYKLGRTFFSKLEELSFSLCEVSDSIRRVFLQCRELRKLTIQSDSNLTGSCLSINLPRLEAITLIMNSDIETRRLYTFFKWNPQLKSVKIIHCGGCIFDEIFPRIANHLPGIESLTIEVDYFQSFNANISSLLRLEHLRELQLNCSMYSIAPFVDSLAAKGKIELLHLSGGLLNDCLIEAIGKCKKLTSLKLCSMPSVHNRFLVELAKNLPELNDFHISKCQTLNAAGVVQFAELAANLRTLHICNSSVDIDDTFFHSLVSIYKQRNANLSISINKMSSRVSKEALDENKQHVKFVRSYDPHLYDVFGDVFDLSEIDLDDDDDYDLDSENDSWYEYDSLDDSYDSDNFRGIFDYDPNMFNLILY